MKLNSTVSDTSVKAGSAHLVGESSRLTPYNPDRAFELLIAPKSDAPTPA